jgi:hypothetical protein
MNKLEKTERRRERICAAANRRPSHRNSPHARQRAEYGRSPLSLYSEGALLGTGALRIS